MRAARAGDYAESAILVDRYRPRVCGLARPVTVLADLTPPRLLLVLANLAGHRTPAFVLWLFAHSVMLLYALWAVRS